MERSKFTSQSLHLQLFYERNYPVTSEAGERGDSEPRQFPDIVTNPSLPIHISSGSSFHGSSKEPSPFKDPKPLYVAYHSRAPGYSRLTVHNSTTLLWERVSHLHHDGSDLKLVGMSTDTCSPADISRFRRRRSSGGRYDCAEKCEPLNKA